MSELDTIFAPATPAGGAIAVLRVSGSGAHRAMYTLTGKTLAHRCMTRVRLKEHAREIDDAMAVCFFAPHSYTGEDMAEIYCHGSQAILRQVCAALVTCGLRPAAAGEFSRRAFLNGKMDLSQAEAVMDLIQADADRSARAALEQLTGRLRDEVRYIEDLLYDALGALSAAIDYPEELEDEVYAELPLKRDEAIAALEKLVAQGIKARVLREGFRVALLGAPNAGKSSLLNALLGYDRAIVTQEPGTTRDTLEERLLLDGIPVILTDTAGLRETADPAEQAGVLRARAAIASADVALLLIDASAPVPKELPALYAAANGVPVLVLRTKADLPAYPSPETQDGAIDISAKTGQGIESVLARLRSMIGEIEGAYITNTRHIHAMQGAIAALRAAKDAADADCAATDLRDALVSLGAITGRAVDDEVIAEIFARFCVGK